MRSSLNPSTVMVGMMRQRLALLASAWMRPMSGKRIACTPSSADVIVRVTWARITLTRSLSISRGMC